MLKFLHCRLVGGASEQDLCHASPMQPCQTSVRSWRMLITSLAGYADSAELSPFEVTESSPQAAKCRHVSITKGG